MTKKLLLLLMLVLAPVIFIACGGDDEDGGDNPAAPEVPEVPIVGVWEDGDVTYVFNERDGDASIGFTHNTATPSYETTTYVVNDAERTIAITVGDDTEATEAKISEDGDKLTIGDDEFAKKDIPVRELATAALGVWGLNDEVLTFSDATTGTYDADVTTGGDDAAVTTYDTTTTAGVLTITAGLIGNAGITADGKSLIFTADGTSWKLYEKQPDRTAKEYAKGIWAYDEVNVDSEIMIYVFNGEGIEDGDENTGFAYTIDGVNHARYESFNYNTDGREINIIDGVDEVRLTKDGVMLEVVTTADDDTVRTNKATGKDDIGNLEVVDEALLTAARWVVGTTKSLAFDVDGDATDAAGTGTYDPDTGYDTDKIDITYKIVGNTVELTDADTEDDKDLPATIVGVTTDGFYLIYNNEVYAK